MTGIILAVCLVSTIIFLVMGLNANKDEAKVQERITELSRGENVKKHVLRHKQMEGSFNERVLFPVTQKFFDLTQSMIPLSNKSWVKTKLIHAGFHKPHYPKVFLGTQLLTTAVLFCALFGFTAMFGKVNGLIGLVIAGFFSMAGYGLPMAWLMQQAQKRQESIQKSLADFLDILVICVEAGLGLDVAINKMINLKTVKTSAYLREELVRYTKDVGFGRPRRDALIDMADRTGVEDLNTIVNAIVQAYEMGSSVALTLRVQADSLRSKRLAKAEEKANKIPVKMVIPIYVFLFPAIFVCIFGPIGLIMVDAIVKIFDSAKLG